MAFISLLKKYGTVFLIYLLGMALSYLFVLLGGRLFSLSGALFGFAFGQWLVVGALSALALRKFKPRGIAAGIPVFSYFRRYKLLFVAGTLYYAGMWIDKVVAWIRFGSAVGNTFFKTFDFYDIPAYIANLVFIPGFLYFIMFTETSFHTKLKWLVKVLERGTFIDIQRRKFALIRSVHSDIMRQSLAFALFCAAFLFIAPELLSVVFGLSVDPKVIRFYSCGVFSQFLFMTYMIFFFYIESYEYAAFTAALHFLLNLIGSIIVAHIGDVRMLGIPYFAAGSVSSTLSVFLLDRGLKNVEHRIFIRASTAGPNA